MMMRKRGLVITWLALITFFSTDVRAAVVDFFWNGGAVDAWSFDYDLQQLTVTQTVSELDPGGFWHNRGFGFGALIDSETTFSVELTLTNNTGVTWSGYILENHDHVSTYTAGIVRESLESTMLQTISYHNGWSIIEFREPPAVLEGESFTVQFDMTTPHYPESRCDVVLTYSLIPEPSTIALFGFGGLALLRTRRARRVG